MRLPKNLITEFVKITTPAEKASSETTVYGTVVKDSGLTYVQLDGSSLLTPVSTTVDTQHGERVTVLIKNHTAIVTGNITSPAARTDDVQQVADAASTTSTKLSAANTEIESLKTAHGEFETLTASNFEATNAKIDALEATHGEFETLTTSNFEATNAKIDALEATHGEFETLTASNFEAVDAKINNIVAGNLDVEYANIDFSNIGQAAMEYFYAQSGLIENVVVSDGTITGNLVGVTIKGDLIEGNTVVADKLVIKGQNGLYYKLNTDGVTTEAEQTEYNSLNGSVITAKSITATKISVDDLVAFDATIGGFNITTNSLYSGVKASVDNTTRGVYLDNDGQVAFGDANNYLKYYKQADGTYKLDISVGGTSLETAIDGASKTATNFLGYDATDGLQVGNKSGGAWSGFRARIAATAFEILDSAGATLASYGEKLVELGKNATDAVIKLCGGKGQIEYVTDAETADNYLQVSADKLRLKSDSMSSLYSMLTDDTGGWEKSAVNVSPSNVDIYSAVYGSNSSHLTVNPDGVSVSTAGSITIDAGSMQDSHGQFLSVVKGTSGSWSYRQWSNGDAELWGSYTVSAVPCIASFGTSMYRTDVLSLAAFPFTVYQPNLTASYESDGYGAILWATTTTTNDGPPNYYLVRAASGTITSGKINIHVLGKWKA